MKKGFILLQMKKEKSIFLIRMELEWKDNVENGKKRRKS